MSWNTVDIGEEEYPGQAQGCGDEWGPCGHDHGRTEQHDYETTERYGTDWSEPVRLPPAEPWPDYGRCIPTKRDLYPNQQVAERRIADIRSWCNASGRAYLPLVAVACEHTDLPLHPGTHYHLRRIK